MKKGYRITCLEDERAYHNTAILIYLRAVRDVLGDVKVRIGNSLNQGYFSHIYKEEGPLTATDVYHIWNRMARIIEENMPIVTRKEPAGKLIEMWKAKGFFDKAGLLEEFDPDELIEIDDLEGFVDCMYSRVFPSAGYVDLYEIMPYRYGLLLRLPNALSPDHIPNYRDDDKLYDAYAACKRMRKATGFDYLADLNRAIRQGRTAEVVGMSEELHSSQIHEFAAKVVNGGKRMVLIAGPSSSGKTTTAKRLCKAIEKLGQTPLYLGTDDYFVERENTPTGEDGEPDFEGIGTLDLKLFNSNMEDLLAGKEVDIPEFNFMTGHKEFGKRLTTLAPGQIIVIEGIHSLNDILTEHIDPDWKFKIYISPLTQLGIDRHNRLSTADARLLRRMVRDNQFRGYDAEATLASWHKVRKGESVNIFPYSSSADVVFNSSTVYETNLLKSYALPLLNAIPGSSPQKAEAERIKNFLRFFRTIDNADDVPQESIIREFIGY